RSTDLAARAAAQHLHLVRHDLGGVAVVARLVLPLSRPELALDIDLRTLPQVLRGNLGQLAEHRNAVPFRAFFLLARLLVFPGLVGRETQIGHGRAAWHVTRLGVLSEIADDDYLVDSASHSRSSTSFLWIFGATPGDVDGLGCEGCLL